MVGAGVFGVAPGCGPRLRPLCGTQALALAQTDAPPARFLMAAGAIDADHPEVRAVAQRITVGCATDRERAVAIHDAVRDEVAFGFPGTGYETRASEVLDAGVGDCHTKGALFVALLRAVGVPARLRFVDLPADLLRGALDPGTPRVDHAVSEVFLDDGWHRTDSYVVDLALARAAQRRLAQEDRARGYGVRVGGVHTWDGEADAFAQYDPDLSERDWGVHADAPTFYRDALHPWNRLGVISRWLAPAEFRAATRRLETLRTSDA